jgi:spermidine synthase
MTSSHPLPYPVPVEPASLRTLCTPFNSPRAVLRMLEPPEEDRRALFAQLLAGTYQKPFLIEDGTERTLEFSLVGGSQSVMHCGDPDALIVPYTREMMAFLLLHPNPRHVVIAGLGGGSLVKYCHRHLSETCITAIEINPWVISLRDEFMIPANGERLSVVCGDARDYFANPGAPADAVLIDLYDHGGAVPFLRDREFLTDVKSHLTQTGAVILNIVGTDDWCRDCTDAVRAVFGDPVLSVNVEADGNLVLLACNEASAERTFRTMHAHSDEIKRRFQLDFPSFLQQLGDFG